MGVRIFFSFPPNSRSHLIQSFGSAFRRSLIFSGTVPSPVHIFIHYQLKNNFANSASFSHDGIETVTFTCIHFRIAFNHIGFGSVKWPDPGASTKRDRLERGKTRWSSDRGKCWFDSPAFWFIPSFLMSLCQLDWNCSCVLVLFRLGSGFVLFLVLIRTECWFDFPSQTCDNGESVEADRFSHRKIKIKKKNKKKKKNSLLKFW